MATTGELRAIIEELQLIDIGDAASYLGEESRESEPPLSVGQTEGLSGVETTFCYGYGASSCENSSFQ